MRIFLITALLAAAGCVEDMVGDAVQLPPRPVMGDLVPGTTWLDAVNWPAMRLYLDQADAWMTWADDVLHRAAAEPACLAAVR
jgi:hypothetical protein